MGNQNDDKYIISYEEIMNRSVADVLIQLSSLKGKALSSLTLRDLSYAEGRYIFPGHGVYLFRKGTEIVYVGKVRNMSFVERIPKHFDLRHAGWFNRLLKLICTKELQLKSTDEHIMKAHDYAFSHLNIVLIHFEYHNRVDRIERLLRSCTSALNSFKSVRLKNYNTLLNEY